MEPISDPAEVVTSRAARGGRSKKIVEVLEASEVEDLSSQLAQSTLGAVPSEVIMAESAAEDIREVELEVIRDTVVAPQEVPRRTRTAPSKQSSRSLISLDDDKPALVEPTFEVVLALPVDVVAAETRFQSTYSRRAPRTKEQDQSEVTAPELSPAAPEDVVPSSEDDNNRTEEEIVVEEIVVEETAPPAKAAAKKSKAKKSKVVKPKKPVSPISLPILEDAVVPAAAKIITEDAPVVPDSPTLGLADESVAKREAPHRAVSLSPAPEEDFVFQPVPSSFVEIMTPGKPLVKVTKGCQHRIGRKSGKSCKSCASEKTVLSLMQDVIRVIEVPKASPVETVAQAGKTAALTTPVKQGDDKENSLKNIDLDCLSIRKLKQVQRTRKPFRQLV